MSKQHTKSETENNEAFGGNRKAGRQGRGSIEGRHV